jgi:hypothetical protein
VFLGELRLNRSCRKSFPPKNLQKILFSTVQNIKKNFDRAVTNAEGLEAIRGFGQVLRE